MHNYELEGNVAVLRFDDGKANVVGHEFIDTMNEGLDRAEQEAKAVLIVGRGGMFSGGFDLKEIQKGSEQGLALVNRGAHMLLRMFRHPQPVVAAATGHAIAAGAFILLASDTRYAADGDFKFGLNETAIGMTLPVFGIQLAAARLSNRAQTSAVTQATIYDVSGAKAVGFVDEVVASDRLLEQALERASALGELPQEAYANNKQLVRAPFIAAIEASLNS